MLTESIALAVGLSRADAWLRREIDAGLRALHGIGYTDLLILLELGSVRGGRLRSTDLAQRLLLTPSGVTRAVLPLERAGLVERVAHERDGRASYIGLSKSGRVLLAQAVPTADRLVRQTFGAALSPSALIALLGFFERLGYAVRP